MKPKWTKQNQIGPNRTKVDIMDRIEPNQTKVDRIELNRTEVVYSTQQEYKKNTFVVVKFGLKIK